MNARSLPSSEFLPIATAPRDGREIEVRAGPNQEIVTAVWAGQTQAWIRATDPLRRSLHRVTGWREVRHPDTPVPKP